MVVARTGLATCPVAILEHYPSRTGTAADYELSPFTVPKMAGVKKFWQDVLYPTTIVY